MLEARDLRLAYGRRTAVHDVSLTIGRGECVALVGPNGSGKSTLLRGLARLQRPRAGAALLDGRPLADWPARQLARRLAILPQNPESPHDLTVAQLVALGRHPHQAFLGLASAADRAVIAEALASTDLTDLADRPLGALSGGERQRAWIALTLAQQPDVLLLDEPTSFLDLAHALAVLDLVRRLNRERGLTVVMALHDLALAARFTDRVLALHGGRLVADGPPAGTLTPALLAEVFGVEVELLTASDGQPVIVPLRVRSPSLRSSAVGSRGTRTTDDADKDKMDIDGYEG